MRRALEKEVGFKNLQVGKPFGGTVSVYYEQYKLSVCRQYLVSPVIF